MGDITPWRTWYSPFCYDADGASVPCLTAADGAYVLIGKVPANGAVADGIFRLHKRIGEVLRRIIRQGQNIKSHPLGGFHADAGERGEFFD